MGASEKSCFNQIDFLHIIKWEKVRDLVLIRLTSYISSPHSYLMVKYIAYTAYHFFFKLRSVISKKRITMWKPNDRRSLSRYANEDIFFSL